MPSILHKSYECFSFLEVLLAYILNDLYLRFYLQVPVDFTYQKVQNIYCIPARFILEDSQYLAGFTQKAKASLLLLNFSVYLCVSFSHVFKPLCPSTPAHSSPHCRKSTYRKERLLGHSPRCYTPSRA